MKKKKKVKIKFKNKDKPLLTDYRIWKVIILYYYIKNYL